MKRFFRVCRILARIALALLALPVACVAAILVLATFPYSLVAIVVIMFFLGPRTAEDPYPVALPELPPLPQLRRQWQPRPRPQAQPRSRRQGGRSRSSSHARGPASPHDDWPHDETPEMARCEDPLFNESGFATHAPVHGLFRKQDPFDMDSDSFSMHSRDWPDPFERTLGSAGPSEEIGKWIRDGEYP